MKNTGFNWQIWAGLIVSIVALMSYPLVFANWPVTRDFPWANLVLFALAAALLFVGVRRAFSTGRRWFSKVGAAVITTLSAAVFGLFILVAFIAATWMPSAAGAPQVGQKAPDFTLKNTGGNPVSLSHLLTASNDPASQTGAPPRGVLLIFYRGHW